MGNVSVNNTYSHSAGTKDILYADGREGEYGVSTYTETKTIVGTTTSDSYTKDSGYTEFGISGSLHSGGSSGNIYARTEKVFPSDITDTYKDLPNITQQELTIDGIVYTMSAYYMSFTTVESNPESIVWTAVFDGIEFEASYTLSNNNIYEVAYKIKNNSGIDNRSIDLSLVAIAADFAFAYSSGLNRNISYYDGDIPVSGTLISYSSDFLEYDLSFAASTGNVSPHYFRSVETMVGGGTIPRSDLYLSWMANLDSGGEVSFGIKYSGITQVGLCPPSNPEQSLDMLDGALTKVTGIRTTYGVLQNSMEYTLNSLSVFSENLADADSRICDADIAKEMMSFTKSNILNSASAAMLSQANQQPQMVLQLLN